MSKQVILVTGANGFLGKALVLSLLDSHYTVRATVRSSSAEAALEGLKGKLEIYNLGELNASTNWDEALKQVDVVIHCAARAHVMREMSADPLEAYREINCQATKHLAEQAIKQGVKRFIFISSIGVLGNFSTIPFSENSPPDPKVPYALAKWEAEQTLQKLEGPMEMVIIRPPLIYGPQMKGNFYRLIKILKFSFILPFGSIKNKRQLIGIGNLIDFIMTCIDAPKAANEVFVVADKEAVSTTELFKTVSKFLGKKILFLPIPSPWIKWGLHRLKRHKIAEQLLQNLEINTDKAKELLGWEAPFTFLEQMQTVITEHVSD